MLQKKSLRSVYRLPYDSSTADLFSRGISDLETMIKHEMALLLFKIKNNLIKCNFRLTTRGEVSGRTTRQSSNFDTIFTKLSCVKDSFFLKGYEIFNSLPMQIKNTNSLSKFKSLSLDHLKKS